MRRRHYLSALAAGAASVAGCGSIQGGDEADPDGPTETSTPTATEPNVELLDASPGNLEFDAGDTVALYVEVRNQGADGSVPLEVTLGNETVVERSMTVEDGRHVEEVRLDGLADGRYEYTVAAGGQTASGTFTVGTPVEKPRVVTSHTVLERVPDTTGRTDRIRFDVEVPGDPYNGVAPPGRGELLDIARKLVLDAIESRDYDAVRVRFWRAHQTVDQGPAHATITWGPNGNWAIGDGGGNGGSSGDGGNAGNSGNGETSGSGGNGDVSSYWDNEFAVAGGPYLVTEGVEDVRTGRWSFTVEFDVVNRGLERETLAGTVSTPATDAHRFSLDLDPGERTTVEYEESYFGPANRITYTVEAGGDGRLYGPRSAEIRFS